jgi:hypothetical protein
VYNDLDLASIVPDDGRSGALRFVHLLARTFHEPSLDLAWTLIGHQVNLAWTYREPVLDMFWTCFGHVLDLFYDNAVILYCGVVSIQPCNILVSHINYGSFVHVFTAKIFKYLNS